MDTPDSIPDSLRNLAGLKIFGRIQPLFAHLHDHACRRDKAANRTLHLDQLAGFVMIAMFNPIARSLRALSQISDLDHIRRRFGVEHASLGSLSEAARLFDPEAPHRRHRRAHRRAPRASRRTPAWPRLRNPLTAVDGTLLKALPGMVESAWLATKDGRITPRLAAPSPVRRGPLDPLPHRADRAVELRPTATRRPCSASPSRPAGLLRDGPLVRPVHPLQRDRRSPAATTSAGSATTAASRSSRPGP